MNKAIRKLIAGVLLMAYGLSLAAVVALTAPQAARASSDTPYVTSAPLLQFTAGEHVIGFQPRQVVMAALDHALRIEFVGTAGVTPVAAASSGDGGAMRQAQLPGSVTYPNVWRGISIEYRAVEGSIVKSTYMVAPGADASQIRLRYNVPGALQSDGSLRFLVGRGYISESAPIAWQEIDGRRVYVPVAFRVLKTADAYLQSEIGFRLGACDPRYPLTIDPNYVWHTFYGSSGWDQGYGIAVDSSNNIYITGESEAAWGSPLHPHSGGYDIVVVKLNSAGSYQWHTFYGSPGSSGWDEGYSIAVDANSGVYITGYSTATWQGDGNTPPLHAHNGGSDIVVLKLNSAGTYQWHTFYGSPLALDSGYGIAVDAGNNVYITGNSRDTWQGDGNTSPLNAYSGRNDIVVLKLTGAGAYRWHTFYGSPYDDDGSSIAVDAGGDVYIVGDGADTWGSPLRAHSGGYDIVALKLSSAGAYRWHTFYGSSGSDAGYGIAIDAISNIYITGKSGVTWQGAGNTNPLHAHSGGDMDIVVVKLNSAGAYQWHTFYGSIIGVENGSGIAVDTSGNVYVTGFSSGAWQGDGNTNPLHAHSGSGGDIAVVKLNSAGAYRWHTFYGAPGGVHAGRSIAIDTSSNVYITGESTVTWQGDGNTDPLHPHSGDVKPDIIALKLKSIPNTYVYLPMIVR